MKKLVLIFIFLLLPLVSSKLVIQNNNINISKTYNEDAFYNLSIKNIGNFPFYNVEFVNNPHISITKIPVINGGETKYVQLKIFSSIADSTISATLRGFYNSSVGPSNFVYNLDTTKTSISGCSSTTNFKNYQLIEGDTLRINNKEQTDLKLYLNNNLVTTISPNSLYSVQNLNIGVDYVYRLEYANHISSISGYHCFVNIKYFPDTDLVNRGDYDDVLNIHIKNSFEKTNISVTFLETNYTTDFFSTQDGIFIIKNSGTKIANNIQLSGLWMTFNTNNFDLEPQQSKTIQYSIKPQITNTTQTNKTYTLNLKISGNFDEYIRNFSVYVKYAEINQNYSSNQESLIDFITNFCNENPNICNTEPRIIYRNINSSDNYFNASIGEEQLRQLFSTWLEFMEDREKVDTFYKEQFDSLTTKMNFTDESSKQAIVKVDEISTKLDVMNNIWIFLICIIVSFVICGILVFLVIYYKRKNIGKIGDMI